MSNQFNDIRIEDLDTNLTCQSDTASGLWHMHLRLSEEPHAVWTQIFESERRFPRHSMWRAAWITRRHIVVDCVPEEIEQYHLKDLKEDVANTNAKFREAIQRAEQKQAAEQQVENKERAQLDSLRNRLNFE